MLRPERMSKVSVTGSRQAMGSVVEVVHDLNLLHLSDYSGEFEGFESGDPTEDAEPVSEKLVTVRSLESILGVTEEDAGPTRIVDEDALAENLETVREEVNELDDRRGELRDDLRSVEDAIETVGPFVDLGIDLDLLSGYDSLEVAVGEADADAVERALRESPDVGPHEVFDGGGIVAAFAYPAGSVEDALVGVEFSPVEVPDLGDRPVEPAAYLEDLEHERERIESRLESVESELEDLRLEHAGFLLAAEERLSIEVQKAEAPLSFATTKRAFVAEGWLPTARFEEFDDAIRNAVGDAVDIEEVERADYADYTPGGHDDHEEDAAADGGTTIVDDGPPVVQNTPGILRPFELLVRVINRPRYGEIDPTVILFLTFPTLFGFMIGDLGYGLLYVAIGYWLTTNFDSDGITSLGGIAMWAGGFTALFGILYGEIFGFHFIATYFWEGALGLHGPPMEKGLDALEFARLWLAGSLVIGLLHLGLGWLFGFVNDSRGHGIRAAVLDDFGPLLLMGGLFVWVFSTSAAAAKPTFLFTALNAEGATLPSGATVAAEQVAYPLGFGGFPPAVGLTGLAVAVVGFVLLVAGEGVVGLLESPTYALVNVLSYTRIAAVLLAKAGMAFVVNLLVVGAYEHEGFHFMLGHGPEWVVGKYGEEAIMFQGLVWMFDGAAGLVGVVAGIVVLIVGHMLVLALGVTSAGLQAVRLEYVEFFSKFYEGGGTEYEPFGYERLYTTED